MKPFPSKVNWFAVWRERWVLLDLINQIAHGTLMDTRDIANLYSGSERWAVRLFNVSRKVIRVEASSWDLN